MLPNGGRPLSNSLRVSTYSPFLYLFLFFINWCAFDFHFVLCLSPLEKDHKGLEYQCSFVRLYQFLFAFLIICIETSCIFDDLYWDFWFFADFFVTLVCRVWNIETIGQYLNWDSTKALKSVLPLLKESKFTILKRALNFWLPLLLSFRTCLSNFRSLSIVTPRSVTSLLSQIKSFPIFAHTFSCL